MAFKFASIEHAVASVAHDIVVGAKKVAEVVSKAQVAAPEVEAITGLVDPAAVEYERAAFYALGLIAKAANDSGSAVTANGLNVQLDASVIADFKGLFKSLSAELSARGIKL